MAKTQVSVPWIPVWLYVLMVVAPKKNKATSFHLGPPTLDSYIASPVKYSCDPRSAQGEACQTEKGTLDTAIKRRRGRRYVLAAA